MFYVQCVVIGAAFFEHFFVFFWLFCVILCCITYFLLLHKSLKSSTFALELLTL